MRIIKKSRLRELAREYPEALGPIDAWIQIAEKARWESLVDIRKTFSSADGVGHFTVFNVKGNHYRLIVGIDYPHQIIYIKYFLTHADYDKGHWKQDPHF